MAMWTSRQVPSRRLDAYKQVIGRHSAPTELPLSSLRSGRFDTLYIAPFMLLYVGVTYGASLYAPTIFLGWFLHLACFVVLGVTLYDLCPPIWTQSVEVSRQKVTVESQGILNRDSWSEPIEQYRGIVAVVCAQMAKDGTVTYQYGAALKHPDAEKTVLLSLSPLLQPEVLDHFAQLLGTTALKDRRFTLELETDIS